ncbi:bifunctional precorrin-2 dehydrogenase/sirohydrochlorin ferrochelatase [Leptospira langatensis]|uniref:precorrin-2 dehydrogenase n=1 Tax=Leptospira langatensis TaxID=2484983 RepID=A0A5F1ZUR3_9LEPT|nr:bifunctional precorrin-2 dehydrogenase/sirohydrochlorin ferrochelatase [Leptospira langatensis]TGK01544.1 bifunctional precorrin-2 dehydrogenase/sirohydrochlorin ferrochelatase [Leptospira langatensis]TGL42006.1 bifunctional precorrin-2 dehydrogenase/sirohydrochlorin ferrochelatase [Leptospira langatensis]
MNKLLPVFLKLDEKKVLVVGGGNVALEKLQHLVPTGCELTVIAKECRPEILELLSAVPKAKIETKEIQVSDLDGFDLIYSATNDRETNRKLVEYAKEKRIWINCADDPTYCDFYSSAYFDRGPIRVAVSTQGEFAGLAGSVRTILEEILPPEHDADLEDLIHIRSLSKQKLGDANQRKAALKFLLNEFKEKYLSLNKKL